MPASPTARTELQRLLSKRGIASRSVAAKLIRDGRVKVNGKICTDPCSYISINATLAIDDLAPLLPASNETVLIAFHKPKGVITTASNERGRKTVYDVLPKKYHHLKPVGRLDMATTGLLLFTNDSKLADRLLDPKNKIHRTYVVTVKGQFTEEKILLITKGISVNNEVYRAKKAEIRKSSGKESILFITLTEGKNREVRRLCEAIGHPVIKLKRISFGSIELGDLAPGDIKVISDFSSQNS